MSIFLQGPQGNAQLFMKTAEMDAIARFEIDQLTEAAAQAKAEGYEDIALGCGSPGFRTQGHILSHFCLSYPRSEAALQKGGDRLASVVPTNSFSTSKDPS